MSTRPTPAPAVGRGQVAAAVAGVSVAQVWVPFLAVLAYFTGTVFYVKTMIRERGSTAYRRASIGAA